MSLSDSFDEALVAAVRSGTVLNYKDLQMCGQRAGVGVGRGGKRYALKAMLQQDAAAMLGKLSEHAHICAKQHETAAQWPDAPGNWWAQRSSHAAEVFRRRQLFSYPAPEAGDL